MLTLLFWNLNGKSLFPLVRQLVREHGVDVLIVAESPWPATKLLERLNQGQSQSFSLPRTHTPSSRIVAFARGPLLPVLAADRFAFYTLQVSGDWELLLGIVHLGSKLYRSAASQSQAATSFRLAILRAENQVKHMRTVLVGDWNMNPFEDGMVSAVGLHAVMTRALAEEVNRTVEGEVYPFFYNPMWAHFGDASTGPPGTYYYRSAEHVAYFWNIFDQVLLRPALLPFFENEDLAILDRVGTTSLLSRKGLPDRNVASDHLPLLFRLRL
jgi:endonuclease/exonuclease/phosphatase family metal-dependent hydrolase